MRSKLKILDLVLSIATLLYGIWLVAGSWPSPTWWSIFVLTAGLIAIPLSIYDPFGRVQKALVGRMIKRA